MKQLHFGATTIPALAVGCMRIADKTPKEAQALVSAALDEGISFFDHADIYGGGKSEEVFAGAVRALGVRREDMFVQTKCGIRKGMYDFSKEHILASVEGSLKRLGTDYVDALLLHRPDTLMEPEEVAEAFALLRREGKVRAFGVSNFSPMQIEVLRQATGENLRFDQLQFGLAHTGMIDEGLNVNIACDLGATRTGGVLEYCRLNGIIIQAWSPFQYGMFKGVFWENPDYAQAVKELDELAAAYSITREAMAIAWILRHPAGMQVICGTTNAKRLLQLAKAVDVKITREEWYRVYLAAGNPLP